MNFLKDDNSNRLTSSNLDMRLFVYINKKILLEMDDKSVKFEELYEVDESFYEQVQLASAENMRRGLGCCFRASFRGQEVQNFLCLCCKIWRIFLIFMYLIVMQGLEWS